MPDFLISTCNGSQNTIKKQVEEIIELKVIKYFYLLFSNVVPLSHFITCLSFTEILCLNLYPQT